MNPQHLALLNVLANHVRFLAVSQVARVWFVRQRHARRQAAQLAQRLAEFGWLRLSQVLTRPVWPLSRPICEWRHSQPTPDFVTIARQLHQRASHPASLTTVINATAKTLTLFGAGRSSPARIKLTQTTHDLHMAEVYLRYTTRGFGDGQSWVGEDVLPATWPLREKPDAILVDHRGNFVRAVEYGGDYPVDRLARLHVGLASIPLPYEIW